MIKRISRYTLCALFVAAGANHFLNATFYVRIMPPYIPAPREMVLLSGACEIVLGAGVGFRRTSPVSAWGLIALLCAVFPANFHMANHAEEFPRYPAALLWVRLPLQAVLIAWAWWHTRPPTD